MSNLMDYMDWRGDVPFSGSPFNEIDNIILSIACMADFSGIVPESFEAEPIDFPTAMKRFEESGDGRDYLGLIFPKNFLEAAHRAAECERFRHIKLTGYVNKIDADEQVQFSATTFILPDETVYIGYRGTDDTLIGWKEDLLLGYGKAVPAQKRGLTYLEDVAVHLDGGIRLGGHSKGGNIAIYSAINAPHIIRARIVDVYNNDGPGFFSETLESEGYREMSDRIVTFLPQSSIVGALFEQSPVCRIIKSTQTGLVQHDPLSWEVKGAKFVYLDKRSKFGEKTDKALKTWIYSLNEEEKELFSRVAFEIIDSTGAKTLTDLNESRMKNVIAMIKTLNALDPETKTKVTKLVNRLFEGNKEPVATVDLCEPGQVKIKFKLPPEDKNKTKKKK